MRSYGCNDKNILFESGAEIEHLSEIEGEMKQKINMAIILCSQTAPNRLFCGVCR